MLVHPSSDVGRFFILQAGGDRTRQPFFGPGRSRIIYSVFKEKEPDSARPTYMVRLTRTSEWVLLLLAVLCVPSRNAAGQDQAQPQNQVPHQNRAPVPQPNQAQPVMRADASTPVSTTGVPARVTQSTQATKSKAQKKQKAPEQPVAEAPASPPTLEQVPPTPPTVTYRNGQLSIQAQNSTLSQVLRAVQAQTGASVDLPGGASGERVVAQLGPGQPRDVLATLLNGSHFNYVILGTPGNSGGVQKVILTTRQSGTGSPPVNPVQNAGQPTPSQDDDTPSDDDTAANYPDNDATQNGQAAPPGRPGFPGQEQQPDNNDQGQGQNGPKTPEQLLQELQRMQQQQQQYQQQLNPANQQPMPNQPQQQ